MKDEGEAELPIADWDRGKSVELAGGTVAARTVVSMCGTDTICASQVHHAKAEYGAITRRKWYHSGHEDTQVSFRAR